MFRSDAMIGRVVGTRLAATSPDGRRRCANERLRKAKSKGSKSSNFALQKAVAIALPLATGLRNEPYRTILDFW
jgi:hypothetical protein